MKDIQQKRLYNNEYHKAYYHKKLKNDPEYKAKQKVYHSKWQKENADKVNQYKKLWRKKRREDNDSRIENPAAIL